MTEISKHFQVKGRVQGVSFRAETQLQAQALGLKGWVRNRPDGSVELVAQGTPGALAELEAWLHQGPAASRVDDVVAEEVSDPAPLAGDFEVRR